ncbi:hypothetical protein [Agrobacterium pusense]|uniref:hypothetical protein n=1 Tax=Agrobacterium pusense TaxID=648995 RepID=UPI001AE0FD32|nr:hypothetical protein [Agrobacterium pusense]MBP2611398.1 hypothetical protein [Agrobacterium pusense]
MSTPIERAAAYLIEEHEETPQQVIHLLRKKFGITAAEAAKACTLANQYRQKRRALG